MIHYPESAENVHIIVAAGSGSRYGGDLPKQFCNLLGRPLLMTTLERLHEATPEARLIVVISSNMTDMWRDMCREYNFSLPHDIVFGGATRAHSVKNAVMTLDSDNVGWVSVHDAARPMITPAIMSRLLDALSGDTKGVIPVVPVTDSLRVVNPDGTNQAVERASYRSVQTPQVFDGKTLIEAYRQEIRPSFTDDASVLEAAGLGPVGLVDGEVSNIKVTNPGDIQKITLNWKD